MRQVVAARDQVFDILESFHGSRRIQCNLIVVQRWLLLALLLFLGYLLAARVNN